MRLRKIVNEFFLARVGNFSFCRAVRAENLRRVTRGIFAVRREAFVYRHRERTMNSPRAFFLPRRRRMMAQKKICVIFSAR
jgi:hypothetical protein